jgi:membrane-associated phospholipid phosphatase
MNTNPSDNKEHQNTLPETNPADPQNRRTFVKRVLTAGAAASVTNLALTSPVYGDEARPGPVCDTNPVTGYCESSRDRRLRAYETRLQAAALQYQQPVPAHPNNGDEAKYRNKIGSYTKGLPHNNLGEVDLNAYDIYLRALCSGRPADFERIPLGCPDPDNRYKFVDPQEGLAFDLEGVDSHATYQPPAPTIGSAQETGEMLELYWMALTRDVPFSEYDTNPLTQAAAADLSRLSDFRGPKVGGQVTTGTLFRDNLPGALIGPYNSQFRYLPVAYGAQLIDQRVLTNLPQDYMTNYTEWLNIQNGCFPTQMVQFDPINRYIRNGRDSGHYVHVDILHQEYYLAMLILLNPLSAGSETGGLAAPYDPNNPYLQSTTQVGFSTFGPPHVYTLMPEVVTRALHAVWFQKWYVHRRLRPEEYGGLIHNTLTGAANYPVATPELLQSPALDLIFRKFGTYLLPQLFPEGAPLHPSYGSGHATVAGACVTILKAWFDENYIIPNPVQPTPDGLSLVPYSGPPLTVGGELNKLASNVAQSRNIAGVHWRTDAVESLKLGETVAISILRDQRLTYNENYRGFSLTKFDGTKVTV